MAEENQGLHVTLDEAAGILHVGVRQVHNHISAGRIRSIKQGRRRLLVAADVYKLADELDAANREVQRISPNASSEQLLAPHQLQAELMQLVKYTGQLEEQLKTRITPEEADELRRRLAEAEGRAKVYHEQLALAQRPLWRKLLGI